MLKTKDVVVKEAKIATSLLALVNQPGSSNIQVFSALTFSPLVLQGHRGFDHQILISLSSWLVICAKFKKIPSGQNTKRKPETPQIMQHYQNYILVLS